ncbi:hypothetical protein GWK08_04565 [Leptobacterium flavescens]|uniref:C1q domain-containing protein n=1 Tax=Leptobacterium flavescens TaxID=472055 RepID=A0A6P0UJH7_9FLAO|nr:hypothetical protein [Leptobacterium flavescens]NER12702.1 hypothetical protein [Leptobacterium flavescens]
MKTMKSSVTYAIFPAIVLCFSSGLFAQVGIGTNTPDASSALEVVSANNNTGVLFPRMTTVQRDAISNPAKGLLIYNTTTNTFDYNSGTGASPNWISLTTGTSSRRARFSNTDTTTDLNSSTFTLIPLFDTTEFNDDSALYQINDTFGITVTEAGRYKVILNIRLLGVNSSGSTEQDTNVLAGIIANSTRVSATSMGYISFQNGNTEATINITDIINLAANDVVGVATIGEGNTGTVTHAFSGDSVFIIEKLD